MKRFVIALAMLSFALILSGTCFFILNKKIDQLHTQVGQVLALTETDDREALRKETEKLMHLWEKNTGIMHMLLMHRAMEEVELNILILQDQLQDEKPDNFRESCEKVKRQLENLKDSEKLSLRNVF